MFKNVVKMSSLRIKELISLRERKNSYRQIKGTLCIIIYFNNSYLVRLIYRYFFITTKHENMNNMIKDKN